jgi:hypothetical protein
MDSASLYTLAHSPELVIFLLLIFLISGYLVGWAVHGNFWAKKRQLSSREIPTRSMTPDAISGVTSQETMDEQAGSAARTRTQNDRGNRSAW